MFFFFQANHLYPISDQNEHNLHPDSELYRSLLHKGIQPFTGDLAVPFSTQVYKGVMTNCWSYLVNVFEVTTDAPAFLRESDNRPIGP